MGMFRLAFVPPDFKVPETVDTERFHLHPLRLQDALEDYRAIMDDYPDHVRNFRKDPDLSREHIYSIYMNMRELGWHEVEFLRRSSFTYVIRGKDPKQPSYRGCIYVYPCAKVDYDVEIYLWVTKVQPDDGLEAHVIEWTRRARDRQLHLAFGRQNRLIAATVAMVGDARLSLLGQVHIHLGIEHPFGQGLLQIADEAAGV
jgi:hypothetical protein